MATTTHKREPDFHWNVANFSLSLLVGIVAVAALWLFAGLMPMLFLL